MQPEFNFKVILYIGILKFHLPFSITCENIQETKSYLMILYNSKHSFVHSITVLQGKLILQLLSLLKIGSSKALHENYVFSPSSAII